MTEPPKPTVERVSQPVSSSSVERASQPVSSDTGTEAHATGDAPTITLRDFQQLIRNMYGSKDQARGVDGTFMWLMEEVGELAAALRSGTHAEQAAEFADVLAWLTTIANVAGVDLTAAIAEKYGRGCPGCGKLACTCDDAEKP